LGYQTLFLELFRTGADGIQVLVHRTEYILKTLNPVWKPFMLPLHKIGEVNSEFLIKVWDWNKSGKMDFIGDVRTTLEKLMNSHEIPIINEKKRKKKRKYNNSGVLHINEVRLHKIHSFLDYIAGGTEINLIVAIDYTASNGDPKYSGSLHYQNPYEPNDYLRAIRSVGDILMAYDSDGRIPLYGFGAKMPDNSVSHCFHINGRREPEVGGIDEALICYSNSFNNGVIKTLYGPTNFAPIIRVAGEIAKDLHKTETDVQAYLILLIITDGEITDMDDTISEIVSCSSLPMSIVIVGVGGADFGKMDRLDSDDKKLQSGNRYAERDIVQFVPFRDFKHRPTEELAAAVLAEIPQQFIEYMQAHRISPNVIQAHQLALYEQQAFQRNISFIPGQEGIIAVPHSETPTSDTTQTTTITTTTTQQQYSTVANPGLYSAQSYVAQPYTTQGPQQGQPYPLPQGQPYPLPQGQPYPIPQGHQPYPIPQGQPYPLPQGQPNQPVPYSTQHGQYQEQQNPNLNK